MKVAALLHKPDETPPIAQRVLRIFAAKLDPGQGVIVRQGLLEERLLTSIHETVLEYDLVNTILDRLRLAPDNPFLSDVQKKTLDTSGLVREGTVVQAGDILASIVKVLHPRPDQSPPALGWQRVRDNSEEVTPGWEGARVMAVKRLNRRDLGRSAPRNMSERVQISLRAERDLAVGDVLVHEEAPLGIVSRFLPDQEMPSNSKGEIADLIVPAAIGQRLGLNAEELKSLVVGKAEERGADVLRARSMEGYSLISLQPLGKWFGPGQPVTIQQVRWLRSRGLNANVAELVSLKSDDLKNRNTLRRLSRSKSLRPDDVPSPGAPESLATFRAWLMALGLHVKLDCHQDHVDLTLRPALTEEILACSSGEITKPETLEYRTSKDTEKGLFCPKVFGSRKNLRRRRFGHLTMPAPIVPFLWRHGSPSILEQLLDLSAADIERIVLHEANVWRRDQQIEVISAEADQGSGTSVDSLGSGGIAIQALLRRVPLDRLPPTIGGRIEALVPSAIPIVPADLRPIVLLDCGNFATHDVNDLYRRIINRRNRLEKLQELQAPPVIVRNEYRELQLMVDQLHANTLLPNALAAFGDPGSFEKLKDSLSMILDHLHGDNTTKRVDWSGQARAVAAPSVPPDRIGVPKQIFDRLQLDLSSPVLVTAANGQDGRFVALLPESHAEALFQLPLQAFARLGLNQCPVPSCILHRPLTRQACIEGERLMIGDPFPAVAVPDLTGWVDGRDDQEIISGLIESALQGSTIHLCSPRGLMLAGAGAVDFIDDADAPEVLPKEAPVREIPEPPEVVHKKVPLSNRLREIVEAQRRQACIFSVSKARSEISPDSGRLGGLPHLPHDVDWPSSSGHQLIFLGQLPLDPARVAGLLPIEVEPGSLLTLFWGEDWWEEGRCTLPRPVFVVSANELVEKPLPMVDHRVLPLCSVKPHIVDEVPCWSEMTEILESELGELDPDELKTFRNKEWKECPKARNAIKIGGWAHWIQGPEIDTPLLAQVVAEDEAEIMFGDSGNLYVLAKPNGDMAIFTQCY